MMQATPSRPVLPACFCGVHCSPLSFEAFWVTMRPALSDAAAALLRLRLPRGHWHAGSSLRKASSWARNFAHTNLFPRRPQRGRVTAELKWEHNPERSSGRSNLRPRSVEMRWLKCGAAACMLASTSCFAPLGPIRPAGDPPLRMSMASSGPSSAAPEVPAARGGEKLKLIVCQGSSCKCPNCAHEFA